MGGYVVGTSLESIILDTGGKIMRYRPGLQRPALLFFSLGCCIETARYVDLKGADKRGGGIFSCIGLKLLSQSKFEADHIVESWILGPHCGKDFPHRAEVLLHTLFWIGSQFDARTPAWTLFTMIWRKDMESFFPYRLVVMPKKEEEVFPLPPGCYVLLECVSRNTYGSQLVCSIAERLLFDADKKRCRHQGFTCE